MSDFISFIKGSINELRNVTWPSKNEVVQATVAVGIFIVIFSAILFGVDLVSRILLQGLLDG